MYKIERNIPMPPDPCTGLAETLRVMEIGDSFVMPLIPGRTSVHVMASRMGIKVRTAKIDQQFMRVWRIE